MKTIAVADFDGGYGRRGFIGVEEGTCDVCKCHTTVIVIDASEGEYRSGKICAPCVMQAVKPQ